LVRGKGRARSTRLGRHYTPEETASYESLIKFCAHKAMGRCGVRAPTSEAVCVTMTAWLVPPESLSKRRRADMLEGLLAPTKKPDADNIAKVVDGLNGIVWIDDAQVVELHVFKRYGSHAMLEITIDLWRPQ
jgi:Holliday junction resolvase RusA-like endonuclease